MEDSNRYKHGERAIAPIVALILPTLLVVVLMVVTAVSSRQKQKIEINIAPPDEEVVKFDDDLPPDETPVETPPEEPTVEIVIDSPTVPKIDEMTRPSPTLEQTPVTTKPAPIDAVLPIKSPVMMNTIAGNRTAGMRAKALKTGGGDTVTEGCVLKALRWLKREQKSDGSWAGNPISNTGLAILSFLAHGETPKSTEFGATVERAVEYLINAQTGEGDDVRFRGADGNEYAFLIATYALAEAYAMTRNPNVKTAALKGLNRIIRNQSPTGGWDYRLNRASTRDDMSFAGWALQALKAGKAAELHPEGLDVCLKKAIKCLTTRNFKNGGFNYTAGGNPTGLTATGCLALQLLDERNRPEVASALDYMRAWTPTFDAAALDPNRSQGACPQYYSYYAAQCRFQAGMCPGATPKDKRAWQDWNSAMKALYPKTQIVEGETGHWTNRDAHGSGDVMSTCLCALQLMVYYRYSPTTQIRQPALREKKPDRIRRVAEVDVVVEI